MSHLWCKLSEHQTLWRCSICKHYIQSIENTLPDSEAKIYVYSDPLFDIEVFGPFTCQEIIIWNITES